MSDLAIYIILALLTVLFAFSAALGCREHRLRLEAEKKLQGDDILEAEILERK